MPTTTTTAMTVADHLASPLPVGTPVRFSPAYECNGQDATTGTVYTVHNHGSSVAYAIRLEGDFYAHRDIFSGSTDNVQRDDATMSSADHLANPLAVGTAVTFSPGWNGGESDDATRGTIAYLTVRPDRVNYGIRIADGNVADRSTDVHTVSPVPTTTPDTTPAPVLPRTAAEVVETARAMQDLARWLPGGELNTIAHEHAEQASLCGEYEAIVCPLLGWVPRNGTESSMMRHVATFHAELAAFEAAHAHMGVLARTRLWLERYEDGGPVNQAIVDHAERHLESHKREAVNELLANTLGWNTLIGGAHRDYLVSIRVERTVEVTAYQYVTVSVPAANEDDAREVLTDDLVASHTDDNNWTIEDCGCMASGYHRTYASDITDYTVDDVEDVSGD